MTTFKRALQALGASATVAAAIVIAPAAAQADDTVMPCAMPTPPEALYYACKQSDTGNKTNMETFATSNGTDLVVEDYANSWNNLVRRRLCTTVKFMNAVHREAGRKEKCYSLKNQDTRTTWYYQLTPYEAETVAYLEIEHKRG